MNIDDMNADEIARYTADRRTAAEVDDIASHLRYAEGKNPGTISAILTMEPERRSNFLWSLRSGSDTSDVDLVHRDGGIFVQAHSNHGCPSWHEVFPDDETPVALVNNGHCPAGMECDECQWEAMTPEGRAAEDARYAAKAESIGGRLR